MSRLKKLARQFDGYIDDIEEFAVLVADFDDLLLSYGGIGETPPKAAHGLGLRPHPVSGVLSPAIIIYVPQDEPGSLSLPQRTKNGFPIHVEFVGPILAPGPLGEVEGTEIFKAHYDKPPGGVSIATLGAPHTGTLGCYLKSGTDYYLLSNRHVLDPKIEGKTGVLVQQQSKEDGNTTKVGIAETSTFLPMELNKNNLADAQIARLTTSDFEPRILMGAGPEYAVPVGPTTIAKVNDEIAKSGRTTGRTAGVVDGIEVNVPVSYPGGTTYTFAKCIAIKQVDGEFMKGGDSGSLLLTNPRPPIGAQPVGLLFASGKKIAFAFQIDEVLDLLKKATGKDLSIVYAS